MISARMEILKILVSRYSKGINMSAGANWNWDGYELAIFDIETIIAVAAMMTRKDKKRENMAPVNLKPLKILKPKLDWMIMSSTPTTVQIIVENGLNGSTPQMTELCGTVVRITSRFNGRCQNLNPRIRKPLHLSIRKLAQMIMSLMSPSVLNFVEIRSSVMYVYWPGLYIFISPWKAATENTTKTQRDRDRQTDGQESKQTNDWSISTVILVNKLTRTLWKHFQQIERTFHYLIRKIFCKIWYF